VNIITICEPRFNIAHRHKTAIGSQWSDARRTETCLYRSAPLARTIDNGVISGASGRAPAFGLRSAPNAGPSRMSHCRFMGGIPWHSSI
jgi:hypothetical protein